MSMSSWAIIPLLAQSGCFWCPCYGRIPISILDVFINYQISLQALVNFGHFANDLDEGLGGEEMRIDTREFWMDLYLSSVSIAKPNAFILFSLSHLRCTRCFSQNEPHRHTGRVTSSGCRFQLLVPLDGRSVRSFWFYSRDWHAHKFPQRRTRTIGTISGVWPTYPGDGGGDDDNNVGPHTPTTQTVAARRPRESRRSRAGGHRH